MTSSTRSPIRLLPLAAIALTLLLVLKIGGIGSDIGQLFGVRTAQASEKKGEKAASVAPIAQAAADAAPTASEADVLASLAERRQKLDQRERDIDTREKVIVAAEKRVEQRIDDLKKLQGDIEAKFGQHDEQTEKQLADLVKTYEAMKPANAAAIFDTLEKSVLLDVVSRMKPAKAALVLAAMKPDRAQEVTVELARRGDLPKTMAADAPKPASPAGAPTAAAPPAAAKPGA